MAESIIENGVLLTFTWYDYGLFAFLLSLSTAIGIYFGCSGNKQSTAGEYLLGGKKMTATPIALSLVACHVSGVTILAAPTDIYLYGTTYCWGLLSIIFVWFINYYVYLPVFYNLEITSIYEYVKMRFNTRLRLLASFLNSLAICLFLPIVIYVPALALSQATHLNTHYITPVICAVCIFYTTIGGLKAVVWTDALQFVAMMGGIFAVVVVGVQNVGGLYHIYEVTKESGRLDYDFDISPFKRDAMWSVLIGLGFSWLNIVCVNQNVIQKMLALPNMKEVRKGLILFGLGEIVVKVLTQFTGLMMLARYYDCDPYTTKIVDHRDQLLPYFIMDIVGHIPGLPGLFIAGIFSASLSTLSACLNCLAGTIYEDFISSHMPKNINQKTISNILKLLVVLLGILVVALVFVVEKLGGLLPLSISLGGAIGGPLLGLFTLGILVPKANAKGALYGTITSVLLMLWMLIGTNHYKSQGYLKYSMKPLRTDGCINFNITSIHHNETIHDNSVNNEDVFFLYRITHYYYSVIGALVVMIVGIPVSLFTNDGTEKKLDKKLFSPIVSWMLPDDKEEPDYYEVDKALKLLYVNNE